MTSNRLLAPALFVAILSTVASGFATAADPTADASTAPSSPAEPAKAAATPKIEFAKLRSKIVPGEKIGHLEGGFFCFNNGDQHASDRFESVVSGFAEAAFKIELKAQGLTGSSTEVSAFDTSQPSDADFRVGGVISNFNDSECTYPSGRKGVIELTIKWDLFSTRQQRVVFSKTVSSAERIPGFENITGRDFMLRAFGRNLRDLLTDADAKAIFSGNLPALPPVTLSPMHLPASRVQLGGTQTNAARLRTAVVTILSDKGSGTGFYVSDGYVLTNKHVVGQSKYVKIKLDDGKEVVGELVREDGPRDVALLKTESVAVPSLSLRLADPAVGEDVYAIGTPLSQKLAGTFTRGVLSGVRESEGVRFYQSDVAVNPGNSGGPLLDAAGNAVGITTFKLNSASGLAFFVPLRDAAERLALIFDAPLN
ncbi:trypsin-like peptidase domain-containing protein [Ideonella azotifigens]|uniref:Trypsin-like peptidase domain-containing protein n=1 Tax=Ideonella azotifigens TaxID=513160 RepID=A0ABN1KKQ7_9BURK|nr:trypsin-like peptidase domain-containing protein [Ideonella azotifigens]MCD2339196.1 trypsin-like peptidase domain-containing protein [Ideonella azotifigens]